MLVGKFPDGMCKSFPIVKGSHKQILAQKNLYTSLAVQLYEKNEHVDLMEWMLSRCMEP